VSNISVLDNKIDLLVLHTRMMSIYSSLLTNGPLTITSFVNSNGYTARLIDDNSQYKSYSDDDFLVAKISRFLSRISPTLEHVVLFFPKYFRGSGAKLFMKKYIMKSS